MTAGKPAGAEPAPNCACSDQTMKLVRTVPGVGSFPELRTFRCERCGHVETVEAIASEGETP